MRPARPRRSLSARISTLSTTSGKSIRGFTIAVSRLSRALALPRAENCIRLDTLAEVFLAGGLVGLALAVRWPYLLLSPPFPQVHAPILTALAVADGQALPLADQSPYLGPLFIYLLA